MVNRKKMLHGEVVESKRNGAIAELQRENAESYFRIDTQEVIGVILITRELSHFPLLGMKGISRTVTATMGQV